MGILGFALKTLVPYISTIFYLWLTGQVSGVSARCVLLLGIIGAWLVYRLDECCVDHWLFVSGMDAVAPMESPTSVNVTGSSLGSTSVELTWKAVSESPHTVCGFFIGYRVHSLICLVLSCFHWESSVSSHCWVQSRSIRHTGDEEILGWVAALCTG